MKLLLGLTVVLGILSSTTFAAKPEGKAPKKPSDEYKSVLEVKEVEFKVTKEGGSITITAKGVVPTGGWSNAELAQYIYINPPADGIYSFDFTAKKPTGIVTQVISPIEAQFVWKNFTADLKAVRVIAEKNEIVKPLDSGKKKDK